MSNANVKIAVSPFLFRAAVTTLCIVQSLVTPHSKYAARNAIFGKAGLPQKGIHTHSTISSKRWFANMTITLAHYAVSLGIMFTTSITSRMM